MGGSLLLASRRVRVLAACSLAVLGADLAVVVDSFGATTSTAAPASVATVVEASDSEQAPVAATVPGSPVVIVGADGTSVQVDPSTPEGQAAIAAARDRGDTLLSVVPAVDGELALVPTTPEAVADALAAAPGVTVPAQAEIVDAVQSLLDDAPDVIADTAAAVAEAATSTTVAAADGGPTTTAAPSITLPDVTIPSVTIPDVTVTLPDVEVSIPPVTVPLVSTTITVPVTVTLPHVTVTVTVPPTTVPPTTSTTALTIPIVTTVSSLVQSVVTTLPVTVPTVTLPHL